QDDAAAILSNVTFFKVAHHGSHNATPKDALEKMSKGKFAAMLSTQNVPWDSIPRLPLLDRLNEQTKNRVLRSDSLAIKDRLAAPGDRLRVRVDRTKGNVVFARIEEIITPSPQRVEPPCPYFGRCGGCDFQQLTYEAQLAAKIEIIRDCLRRLGGIENVPDFQ